MTFDELKQIVQKAYDATARRLAIRPADFGASSTDLNDLFNVALKGVPVLNLDQVAKIDVQGQGLSASGRLAGVPGLTAQTVQAQVRFQLAPNGQPGMTLWLGLPGAQSAPGASAGTLTAYFPQLADTFLNSVAIARAPAPDFIYSSFNHVSRDIVAGQAISLVKGLNFHGGLVPAGHPFDVLAALGGSLAGNSVTGPIVVRDYGPKMTLALDKQANLSHVLAALHLPATLTLESDFTPDGSYHLGGIRLAVPIELGHSKGLTLEAFFDDAQPSFVTLQGTFQNVPVPSPSDLVRWIGGNGADLGSLLPDALKPSGAVLLDSMWISVSASTQATPSVASVGFGLTAASGKGWEIVPHVLTLGSLSARFAVTSPFSASRKPTLTVEGVIDVPGNHPALQVEAGVVMPRKVVSGRLVEGTTFNLTALVAGFLPAVKDAPSLVFDQLGLVVDMGHSPVSYQLLAATSSGLSFTFGGAQQVTLDSVMLRLDNGGRNGAVTGTISGSLSLFGARFDAAYDLSQGFRINGQLPSFTLDLQSFVTGLTGQSLSFAPWIPALHFSQTEIYVAHSSTDPASDVLALRTLVTGLPVTALLAFEAMRVGGAWQFAVAIDLGLPRLSSVPGLAPLAIFDQTFQLDELLLVASSTSLGTFDFPGSDKFATPALATKTIKLPAQAGGLQQGLYVYARGRLDGSAILKLLGKTLQLGVQLGVSLFIGKNPSTDSRLMITVPRAEIAHGMTLTGMFGAQLQGGELGLFVQGELTATVAGHPLIFDLVLLVVPNGLFFSGTMKGTLEFAGISLSNLAVEIGIDLEGIPSAGIAATIDTKAFDTSLALFFDSADPAKSLLAGAVSDTTLHQFYQVTAGRVVPLPSAIGSVLDQIAVRGTDAFDLPGSLGPQLDDLAIAAVSAAFAQKGKTIPASQSQVLLVAVDKGKRWVLTDLTTMRHYSLALSGSVITAKLEAQLYCAPQATQVGSIAFPAGFFLAAEIQIFSLKATVQAQIDMNQGIVADAALSPITIYKPSFFSVTDASGQSGPRLSIATYNRPQIADANLRSPHVMVSGALKLLGRVTDSVYLSATPSGLAFSLTITPSPLTTYTLSGSFAGPSSLGVSGSVGLGLHVAIDFGALGRLSVDTTLASGAFSLSWDGHTPSVKVTGSITIPVVNQTFSLTIALDPDSATALEGLAADVLKQLETLIRGVFADPRAWLGWIARGVLVGIDAAKQVGQILATQFQMAAKAIADNTQKILNYTADQVAQALSGAGVAADEAARILGDMYGDAGVVTHALQSAFTNTHADTSFGHIDTPAGPHTDVGSVPHGDTSPHVDTPSGPHTDVGSHHIDTPHGDVPVIGTVTPHADTSTPHADFATPPHGDTHGPHVDTPSTPHADFATPPHGDTHGPHVDTTV